MVQSPSSNAPPAREDEAGFLAAQAAEAVDQRPRHVGEDGDLQQLHEGAAADAQERDLLAEEEAEGDPEEEGEQDLLGEAHLSPTGRPSRPGSASRP